LHQRGEAFARGGSGQEACLTQCFTNLVSNALNFVAPGVLPAVRIRSEPVGDKVRVWISDNGIGIPAEHQGTIFQLLDVFIRPNVTKEPVWVLAIVKKAVARMGGETGFQSTVDRGSDFWFTLQGDMKPADNGWQLKLISLPNLFSAAPHNASSSIHWLSNRVGTDLQSL